MCITPNRIAVGYSDFPITREVACRKCWQCCENRVNDYVGRAIAESLHTDKTLSITLTYGGGDTPDSVVLVYKHVQLFIKSLRNDGYKVRYMVAGEYGSGKGRSHWHVILFFNGKVPKNINANEAKESVLAYSIGQKLVPMSDIVISTKYADHRFAWKHWPHGFVHVEEPSYKAFRYVLKYVLKDTDLQTSVGHFSISKKPPLGDAYFREYAARHANAGTHPDGFNYSFNDEFDALGKRRKFYMQGVTRENFIKYYEEEWLRLKNKKVVLSEQFRDRKHKAQIAKYKGNETFEDVARNVAYKASKTWSPNNYVIRIKVVSSGHFIVHYALGGWQMVNIHQTFGELIWRKKIDGKAEMRLALLGKLRP